jgi:membrane protein implicated in regulation of membrane protease activity
VTPEVAADLALPSIDVVGEWMADNEWVVWLLGALALGGIELATLDLVFLMLAAGALAGSVTAAVGAPFLLQVLVGSAVAIAMLAVVRPIALRHLKTPHELRTGVDALVGREAITLDRVDIHGGRVKLAGEVWSARTMDGSLVIEPGRTVDVLRIDGAVAVVYELDN